MPISGSWRLSLILPRPSSSHMRSNSSAMRVTRRRCGCRSGSSPSLLTTSCEREPLSSKSSSHRSSLYAPTPTQRMPPGGRGGGETVSTGHTVECGTAYIAAYSVQYTSPVCRLMCPLHLAESSLVHSWVGYTSSYTYILPNTHTCQLTPCS